MLENIGQKDKIIRYVLGIIFMILGIVTAVNSSEVIGIIFIILALIMLFTALFNFCPIYYFTGMKTKDPSPKES